MEAQDALGRSSSSEAQLISSCRAGDRDKFAALIGPYIKGIRLVAYSILRNPQDTEEVSQEAILKAFIHLSQLREGESFKAWLLQIAANEAKMRLRKDRRHLYESLEQEFADKPVQPRQFVDWRNVPSADLERKELRAALMAALNCLEDGYREVFVLRDIQELCAAKAGEILGISEGAVNTRLHRARMQMREQLIPLFSAPGKLSMAMPFKMMLLMGKTIMKQTVSCKHVTSQISNYIDGHLSREMKRQIEKHLALCDRCSVLVDTMRKLLYIAGNEKVFELPFACKVNWDEIMKGEKVWSAWSPD
ncbi:MAG TPA: sigma-70 family RNA polymerase sigma factor [Candidatus Saccharimonadales bacterium]|jgi:RNA polymerase sigma-70 factor (ECF subfamily)|nr:sigma-70 family RNA polymerase sigma factor [Candidatus Saccharimonadales bacterium]